MRKNGKDEWQARDCKQLSEQVGEQFGLPIDMSAKMGGLRAIANALNEGDLPRAQIAAVLLGIPDPPLSKRVCSRDQMIELIRDLAWGGMIENQEEELAKYNFNPDEARNWHGYWSRDGETSEETAPSSRNGTEGRSPTSVAFNTSNDNEGVHEGAQSSARENSDQSRANASLQQSFEQKYDNLGPVDFSKQAWQFGYWLDGHGKSLSPIAHERALAEYNFVQDRLSFWLSYEHKPAAAQLNLISAADMLYQGAINGGIVEVGHFPPSMADVFGAAWGLDGGQPRIPSVRTPNLQRELPEETFGEIEGLGLIVNNGQTRIVRGEGINEQDGDWEVYIGRQNPQATKLPKGAKAFDLFDTSSGEAISAKTLDTLTFSRIKNPSLIYNKLKGYIDTAAGYEEPRAWFDIEPAAIKSKTLQLAVPEYTSPTQWRQLFRAIVYGREHGVSVVVTKIRE